MRPTRISIAIMISLSLLLTVSFLPQPINIPTVVASNSESGFFEGDVPPRGAYLQTLASCPYLSVDADEDGVYDLGFSWDSNGDGIPDPHYVQDPLIVDLQAHGFVPGDKMMIGFKQSLYNHNCLFNFYGIFGLFSSTDDLLNDPWTYDTAADDLDWPIIGPSHRVPGAIDVALGGYSHTYFDDTIWAEFPIDISEDFYLNGPVCDCGMTWGSSNCKWVTVPDGAKFLFIAPGASPIVDTAGTCRVTLDEDADGDGIPDSWERKPIDINKDGITDLTLLGASDSQKDIFVEVDHMEGEEMAASAKAAVEQAFEECPSSVEYGPIALHIELDEEINWAHVINGWDAFDDLKKSHFGSVDQHNEKWAKVAKNYTYHYCIFIDTYAKQNETTGAWEPTTSSGRAEIYGNDFWVSLGSWNKGLGGTPDEQAAAFMHELGHNLNLNHGGEDEINYKPNYLSVMNYLFMFKKPVRDRPLTYSSSKLATLDESDLDERAGIGDAPWPTTAYSAPISNTTSGVRYCPLPVSTSGGIDWNNNGEDDEVGVEANINNFPIPEYDYVSPAGEVLEGYEDWPNLKYDFHQSSENFDDGAHSLRSEHIDLTWEIVQNLTASEEYETPSEGEPLPMSMILGVVAIIAAVAVILGTVLLRRKRK